MIFYETVLITC